MRRFLRFLPLLALVSCDSTLQPDLSEVFLPQAAILDGSQQGGNPGFGWLPPIVKSEKSKKSRKGGHGPARGEFDASLLPFLTVEVCEWTGAACAGAPIRSFSAEGRGSERLRITEEHGESRYHVDWRTKEDRLDAARDYRIRVLVGALEVGHADVDVVAKPKSGKGVDRSAFVVLKAGSTLPIKFVITDALEGAAVVGREGGVVTLGGGTVVLEIPAGALESDTPITVQLIQGGVGLPPLPQPIGGVVFDFGPDGIVFGQPITMTLTYDPLTLPPGVNPAGLRIHKLVNGSYVEMAGGVVDLVNNTVSAQVDGFSSFVLLGPSFLQPGDLCSDYPATAIATFEDANLEAAVRAALGVGAGDGLTCGLLATLTSLSANSAGITSLVGMQNLTSATNVNLEENAISDLSALSGLTSLTSINLYGNTITDVSALSGLNSLTVLALSHNSISDISPLSGLTGLTLLALSANAITDISALSGLTDLPGLSLGSNAITDISALSGLTSLTVLNLYNNTITDISALSGLTSLNTLYIGGNAITDISALSALTSLTLLYLHDNTITDISALSGLTSLSTLYLHNNTITDISSLSALTSLNTLYLYNNTISEISALSGLTSLTVLGLYDNTSLSNIQPLLDNPGLGAGDTVHLTGTSVSCTDVAALAAKGVGVSSNCS